MCRFRVQVDFMVLVKQSSVKRIRFNTAEPCLKVNIFSVTANDFLNVIHGYGYVVNHLHIGTLCLRVSFLSFFFLGFILLLCVSMCVCLCDYNTYYKCQHDEH